MLDPGSISGVGDPASSVHGPWMNADSLRLAMMGVCILFSLLNWWRHWLQPDWVALAATLAGGWPVYAEAWHNLRKKKMTMELSMTIALLAALGIGEFLTALVIAFFVLFAERIEGLTMARGRHALGELIESLPRTVLVLREGREVALPAEEVTAGETVLVRPGERVAADGTVLRGNSSVNEASITGESVSVEKSQGSRVYAGTVNEDGSLEVRAERMGRDTTFGKIIGIVEQAERSKAPVERVADRLAAGLVTFAMSAALLTLALTRDVTSAISVVLVVGACGVAAGTPLAILAGIGGAARRGIVIKGGVYLEQLSRIDTVVLDKTGTLTLGTPEVTEVIAVNGASNEEVLVLAASAELHSEHPLGQAIVSHAREARLTLKPLEEFSYVPGRGLVCIVANSIGGHEEQEGAKGGGAGSPELLEMVVGSRRLLEERGVELSALSGLLARPGSGESRVFVARGGRAIGAVILTDQIRPEAKRAIGELNERGYRTVLLSGDADSTAKAVGATLNIAEAVGGLLPHEKLERVNAYIKAGRRVVMVGDGVNDAPALAAATVGIAMGQGTDVALETADVSLMQSNLSRLVEMFDISHRCRGVIQFNFWGTILVDCIGIVLAALGMLVPVEAALIHVGSELAFILNSARLFRHWR